MQAYAVPTPGQPVEAMELPTPELTGKSVLVDITHSGVCHSDVHTAEGFFDLGQFGKLELTAFGTEFPAVFGHEIVGTVSAVGPDATVAPGDEKFIVFPWIGCGECVTCQDEKENLCPQGRIISGPLKGGFAHQVWVPDEKYLVPLGDLDPAWGATLACAGITAFSAVNKLLPAGPEDTIAVIGAGGVGLMAVAMLKALGHLKVAVVDVSDENLELAKSLGASITVNSMTAEDPIAALVGAAGGEIHGAVDFVNNDKTAPLGFHSLRKGGTLVSVGLFGGMHTYPTSIAPLKVLNIRGSFVGSLPELKEVVEIARTHDLPKLPIVEKPMNADVINETMQALAAGGSRGRTVLTIG
ncbi:alcohol dehydrogenase [Brevibacterium litoralis]|uniref:alcohol dehydrogenase n=1 Tax=Brevibacterium litoralis TaxID=3138935 RepID=UPI0032EE61E0